MGNIAIVTDTSSDLTPQQAAAAGIGLVPLTVSFGDETFEAGTELTNEEFYKKLTAPGAPFPRTAAPNPAQFEAAYREALEGGADGVVCVTISQKLSATYSSAVQAAGAFEKGQVEVVDCESTTHTQAMIAAQMAELADGGAPQAEVVAHGQDLVGRSETIFAVETLEYLQKGGRIGRASALFGTVLSIKPILRTIDGEVHTADKRRTAAKARARLLELATEQPVERATVVHILSPGIEDLRTDFIAAAGISPDDVAVGMTGPVAGSHIGPGMYGFAIILTA